MAPDDLVRADGVENFGPWCLPLVVRDGVGFLDHPLFVLGQLASARA